MMQENDDLVALFSRNLTLQQPQPQARDDMHMPAQEQQSEPQPQQQQQQQPQPTPEPIKYSITQHYHPTAYIYRESPPAPAVEPPRRSSEPPQTQQLSAELVLLQHGVDARHLSTAQLELFKTAEDPQKRRLIELWRICPPENPQENPSVALQTTTVDQEEFLAQLRYQRAFEENEQKRSMDSTPLTPVQTGEGNWVATAYMEPYMATGYEELARREYEESAKQHTFQEAMGPKHVYSHFGNAVGGPDYRQAADPVYDANEWARRQQAMEDQYGAYQQMEL